MSAEPIDLALSDRAEVDIAADAVWALVAEGVLPRTPKVVRAAADAAHITIDDLRAADVRRIQYRYVPPRRVVHRHDSWSDAARERWAEGTARGSVAGAAIRSRQPKPTDSTMTCAKCGNDKTIDVFEKRPDRPGKRRTTCQDCRREASRDRYLSVDKQKAMNAARLTFVICADDLKVDIACIDCGEPFRIGDEVSGMSQLYHTACPGER